MKNRPSKIINPQYSAKERVERRLISIVNARYSLPTWLWTITSTLIGLIVIIYVLIDPMLIAGFTSSLVLEGRLWGGLLVAGGVCCMTGMSRHNTRLVKMGAFLSFCMWIFGTISLYLSGSVINLFVIAGPYLAFWAYKYVASYIRELDQL